MADPDSSNATGRLLLLLAGIAVLVMLVGIAVVWALSYGPFG